MADRVLVTGVSGFLGGHVALALLRQGYIVRGSLRSTKGTERVRRSMAAAGADPSGMEFVELDLLNDAGWREAMKGVRYLQHIASPFHLEAPRDKMELIRPAVGGTERALHAALAENVERIVLTSSIAAILYGHAKSRTRPFSGEDWTQLGGSFVPAYQESKTLAERRAWKIMGEAGRTDDLVAINPGAIMGPLLDDDPGTSAGLILAILKGTYPALPRLETTIVDVRDVAEGHVRAMTNADAGGKRIPFSADTLTFRSIADLLKADYPNSKVPARDIPNWIVRALGLFNVGMRGVAAEFGYHRVLETAEAVALLGHPLVPARDAILSTARSLTGKGLA